VAYKLGGSMVHGVLMGHEIKLDRTRLSKNHSCRDVGGGEGVTWVVSVSFNV
jgi:hypothetical protein